MERILVVRLGAMGDVIHAMPAVAALRKANPGAFIGWVIEERWSELLVADGASSHGNPDEQRPLIDRIHTVNTRAWRENLLAGETWDSIFSLRDELHSEDYDIAIDFQGATKSGMVAFASGAKIRRGFDSPRELPAKIFYNRTVKTTEPHVVGMNFQLAEVSKSDELTPLPRGLAANHWVEEQLRSLGGKKLAILNPGAGWQAKEWPADKYGQLAKRLAQRGFASLVNIGPGEREAALATTVEQVSGGAANRIVCSVGQLIALTRNASLFVGGDTGPMHMANALRIPTVAIFGPTDPARNGPYFQPSVTLRNAASQTSYSHSNTYDAGITAITVDEVFAACEKVIAR
jgi:heptosyltransferase-1